jgi:hypothetical protein
MRDNTFKALVLNRDDDRTVANIRTLSEADLPEGDVLVAVEYCVSLLGVDSVMCPSSKRRQAWTRLARDLPADALARIAARTAALEEIPSLAADIIAGKVKGRVVVNPNL